MSDSARRAPVPLADRRTGLARLLRGQVDPKRVSLLKPINVGLMAELAAEKHGRVPIYLDQPFTWDPQKRVELDFVECAVLIEQFSAVLKQAGVTKRDRVVILKTPNYDIQSLAWAAARIGAVPALLSARLDPDIINILLERIDARFIITDPAVAERVGLDAARLKALNCTAIAPIDGGIPVEDLWGGPIPSPNPGRNDEPMMITHTSSTTGVSKLAEASATGVGFSAFMESVFPSLHSREDLFASVISHVHVRAAVTQQAAFSRGTPLLGIASHDDDTIVDLFSRYRPTLVEGHPNAYVGWEKLVDHPSKPFASIRTFMNTFDAIHPRTIRTLLEASERISAERVRAEEEEAAREQARRERARAAARERLLADLAVREDESWRRVDDLAAQKNATAYDEAVRLLIDLREIAARDGRKDEAHARTVAVRERHMKKRRFVERLDQAIRDELPSGTGAASAQGDPSLA